MPPMWFLFCVDVLALLGYKCGARRLDNLEEDVRTRLWVLRTDTCRLDCLTGFFISRSGNFDKL